MEGAVVLQKQKDEAEMARVDALVRAQVLTRRKSNVPTLKLTEVPLLLRAPYQRVCCPSVAVGRVARHPLEQHRPAAPAPPFPRPIPRAREDLPLSSVEPASRAAPRTQLGMPFPPGPSSPGRWISRRVMVG